jgi:glycosyltransferase involved in cell wall biosynthesis
MLRGLRHLLVALGRSDFHCFVVGSGGAWAKMKELSAELGLTEQLTFTGWVAPERVKHFISAADICIAPEPSNPYNDRCTVIKIAEYMALGKPVVAFDLPEHRVTAQTAAVYVTPNDELELARQLALLMDDPARRQAMGQQGREQVLIRLAWPHQLKHLLTAYASLEADSKLLAQSIVASREPRTDEERTLQAGQDPT